MDETLFYVLGAALVVAALGLSAVGVRWRDSFPSADAMWPMAATLALLVCSTGVFAVLNARAEEEHRNAEQAAESAAGTAEVAEAEAQKPAPAAAPEPAATGGGGGAAGAGGESFDITSPADGSLSFEPPDIEAKAGTVTIAYENPSPVTHNVFLQDDEDQILAESDDVTEGSVEISAELPPGEYIYYCNIPGHREGGMEGVLTVK